MPALMIFAVILFTVAMVLYTTGIWAERYARRLKMWHVQVFFTGVVVDAAATYLTYVSIGSIIITAHSIAGFISLLLMFLHFTWAAIVITKGNEQAITSFHRLSMFVWLIWMISYLSGFLSGINILI